MSDPSFLFDKLLAELGEMWKAIMTLWWLVAGQSAYALSELPLGDFHAAVEMYLCQSSSRNPLLHYFLFVTNKKKQVQLSAELGLSP